jgi:hypothetical protein
MILHNKKNKFIIILLISSFFCVGSEVFAGNNLENGGYVLELKSEGTDFSAGNTPILNFDLTKKRGFLSGMGARFLGVFRDEYKKADIRAELSDADGNRVRGLEARAEYDGKGEFRVIVENASGRARPGVYNLEIIVSGDGIDGERTFSQDFSWGVLAFNSNKSIYKTGEEGWLQMAVLDELGHTLCGAGIYLEITAPDDGVAYLDTDNGLVVRNRKCGPDNIIDEPDYYAFYGVGPEGRYEVKLTALTTNGERTIYDAFEVDNGVMFEVERVGPTRINPVADYRMKILIKAEEDFKGNIAETVPSVFQIFNQTITNNQDTITKQYPISNIQYPNEGETKIVWENVDLKAGEETTLSYTFDAPNVSPEFYLLGPLELSSGTELSSDFAEIRNWQIASDATSSVVYVFNNGTHSSNWTSPANAFDGTNNTHANKSIPRQSQDDSGNYLVGTTSTAVNLGNAITRIELGVEGYIQRNAANMTVNVRPVFEGSTLGSAYGISGSNLGLTDNNTTFYADITNDGAKSNPGSWTWSEILNLDVRLFGSNNHQSQASILYIDAIRLRVTYELNEAPTADFSKADFRSDGTGKVDLAIAVDDPDDNDQVRAKIEYVAGSDCNFTSPFKATLDEVDANATSTYGDAKILNSNEYQIGNSSGWILTSSGANTVNFDWNSKTDIPNASSTYCLRVTAYDGVAVQTSPATTTVYIKNYPPQISSVTFNPSSGLLGIGHTATATIYADASGYTAGAMTINGTNVASTLIDNGDNTYTVSYTVVEGHTNRADSADLPVSFVLKDSYNNSSAAYTTADAAGRPGVDAQRPVVANITIPNNAYKIGDKITIIITVNSDADTYTMGNTTINNILATNLVKMNNTTYNADYTVLEGHADRAAGTIPASVILVDSAGNSNSAYTTVAANSATIDANKPEILSVSIPSRVYKIGDVIRATTTVSAPAVSDTYTLRNTTVNGVTATNIRKINESTYTFDYTVVSGNTDRSAGTIPFSVVFQDSVGQYNDPPFTAVDANTASIDANRPVISAVSFVPSSGILKVGDTATVTITAANSETGLLAGGTMTINNVDVSGTFTELGAGQYRVVYTVMEGHTDRADSADLPVNLTLRDAAGNQSTAYTTADPGNRPGVDANTPSITAVSFVPSSGVLKVGDKATATISVSNSETGLLAGGTMTINNVDVSGTFTDMGAGQYRVVYTVVEGHNDIADSAGLPVNFSIRDAAGNISLAYTTADPDNRPGVDANTPSITAVSFVPSSGVLKVGDTATATIMAADSETGLLVGGTMTINNVDVSGTFTELGGGQYRVVYTVMEGHTDRADSANLPVNFTLRDAAGNQSIAYTTADPDNRPGVDANTPSITAVSFVPSSGVLKVGDTATATISVAGSETGLLAGGTMTINNVDVAGTFIELGAGQYRVVYTVAEGHTDRADSADLPVNLSIRDSAGNQSPAYTTADPDNRPGVDANTPSITAVSFVPSSGVLKVGDTATVTITAADSETGLLAGGTMNINNVNVAGTFTELGAGQYRVVYTVMEGHTDRADSADLPVNLTLRDAAGNQSTAYTTADPDNRPGVDANTPSITAVSFVPSSGVLKVGDSATATISVADSETGLLAGGTMTINNVDVSGTFTELGGGQYRIIYTVIEGHNDIADSADLPVNLAIRDAVGNQSPAYTTADPDNRPGVDGNSPTAPGNLSFGDHTSTSITLNFGATTTESNFSEYKIFYKIAPGPVTESHNEWNSANDANLANILFNEANSTTITGLSAGTTYIFNIWAYDEAGNKTAAEIELSANTNHFPSAPSGIVQYKSDGVTQVLNGGWNNENTIRLQASVTDNDPDETLTLYFEVRENGSAFTGDAASPCSYSTAWSSCTGKVWEISSFSGDYSVTPYTGYVAPSSIPDSATGYKWQVKACDSHNSCSDWVDAGADPNFKIDNTDPTAPGNLTENSKTSISITLNLGASSVEDNFKEYVIYYKEGSSGVTESDSAHNSANDANLAVINFNGAATTTIGGLTAGTQYVFNIWAYDLAGNKANAAEISISTDFAANPPIGYFNSAVQKTDGSGGIDISIFVDDPDNDDTLRVKLEYEVGTDCSFLASGDPTIDVNNVSATNPPAPVVDNSQEYQVGTTSAWIKTAPDGNTVGFDWLSKSDIPLADGYYCLRMTANDGLYDQDVPATTTVYIDNTPPSAPGALSLGGKTTNSLTLSFGSISGDTNFSHYKIFYKPGTAGVSETDIEHVDSNLNDLNYNFSSNTTISGLSAGTDYVFNIWAYDSFGNKASSSEFSESTNHIPANPLSLEQFNEAEQQIDNGAWITGDAVKLRASANDEDASEALTLYFELLTFGETFTSATSIPAGACAYDDFYEDCLSKIWFTSSLTGDYSNEPFTASVTPQAISDSSAGYKWQVMACDDDGACSDWTQYNETIPNFKIDHTPPTAPGNLTEAGKTATSITLNYGATTTEDNFFEYRIYYKEGTSGVAESDNLHSSSTDANLGYINYNGAANTVISGLDPGTQYVFNIWAYDEAGNKTAATEMTATTNNYPAGSFLSTAQKTNGSGAVDISIQVSDLDADPSMAKLEYVSGADCNFASPLKPTLDQTDANATSTYGDAKILNSNEYQIGNESGWIYTYSGPNAVHFDWLSKTDINNQQGVYCLRLTVNDGRNNQLVSATTTVYIDNLAPTVPGNLSLNLRTGTTMTLNFGSPSFDHNFSRYRIYYRQGAATVTESDSQHIDVNLNSISFNGAATTTITGLLNNTQYSFRIFAYDAYGNKSNSGQTTFTTNALPTGSFNSVAQKTNGTGIVDISIQVYDINGDNTKAKIEYVAGADCNFSSPQKAALDENDLNTVGTYGDPKVNNANEYQIGNSDGWITTSEGSNTVIFDWLSKTDLPAGDGIYCLRLTVNDGIDDQAVRATTTLTIDNVPPTIPGDLAISLVTGYSAALNFGAQTVDSNFSEYRIYYKKAISGVTTADSLYSKLDNSNLGYIDYGGVALATISNLSSLSDYVFNIWAYDTYGNRTSALNEVSTTTLEVISATWRESEDIPDPTSGFAIGREGNIRLRLSVANAGDYDAADYRFLLEYGVKGSDCTDIESWTPVAINAVDEHFQMIDSIYFDNMLNTTQRLLNGEGYAFTAGFMLESPSNHTNMITLPGGNVTEIEYAFSPTAYSLSGGRYCFRVTNNGEELHVYSNYPELTLAPPPTAVFNSAVQKTNGTGGVDINMRVENQQGDPVMVKVEYEIGDSCSFASSLDPTLNETIGSVTAEFGTPTVDNSAEYQVGSGGSMILTAYGQNNVDFDWLSKADLNNQEGTYCLRLTASDGYADQLSPATTTVEIDNLAPTVPGNLTEVSITSNSITLGLGTSSIDANFKEYIIFYKEGSSGVTESDSAWTKVSDPNLGSADYNGATTTTVTGLEVNKQYVFRIWAYDQFGNKTASVEEVSVIIRYVSVSESWRWYYDEFNETPTSSIAIENTAPNDITEGSTIKLRLALREIESITGENVKIRLQYSTFSDFSTDVNFVGEKGSSYPWTYGDGVDNDNDPIIEALLAGITLGATHNESGISTTSYDHIGGTAAEWEFTIRNNGAVEAVTYYFRAYDNTNNEPIDKGGGYQFPSLTVSAGSLTYTVSGVSSGYASAGVTSTVNTEPGGVPFGYIPAGNEAIGIHRLTVNTNAGSGYQLFVYKKQHLLSENGAYIDPVPHTNESPSSWPANPERSAFGYHTSDSNLSGTFPARFANDGTYAAFEQIMKEVSYSPIPVENKTVDLVYRLEVGEMQEAGDYETEIVYILVPVFY